MVARLNNPAMPCSGKQVHAGCGEWQSCMGLHMCMLCNHWYDHTKMQKSHLIWLKNTGQVFPFLSRGWSAHSRHGLEKGASLTYLLHWLPRAAVSLWGPRCQWWKPCGWQGRPPDRHGAGTSHLGCPLPGFSPQSYPGTLQRQQKTKQKTLPLS